MVVVLVVQGNTTHLETDAAGVGLETILLQMPIGATEVADANERAMLHSVPFALAPEAFVAQFV